MNWNQDRQAYGYYEDKRWIEEGQPLGWILRHTPLWSSMRDALESCGLKKMEVLFCLYDYLRDAQEEAQWTSRDWTFLCPYPGCRCPEEVAPQDKNCGIFRHGHGLNPHAKFDEVQAWKAQGPRRECGQPLRYEPKGIFVAEQWREAMVPCGWDT